MMAVRRFVAMLLLAMFALPFVSSSLALGQGTEGNLPACCRRMGKHHCAMSMGDRAAAAAVATEDQQRHWKAPVEKCPYCPCSTVVVHPDPLSAPPVAQAVFAGMVSHPSVVPQTESRWRIARDRSRQKRGPPSFVS